MMLVGNPVRSALLVASRQPALRRVIEHAPVTRGVVRRFVAGDSVSDAIRTSETLGQQGLSVTLDHLGEDITRADQAAATTAAYLTLLDRLGAANLTEHTEVSVKLSAVGQALDSSMALDNARAICEAAAKHGTTVTLDMEDHTTTDATLGALRQLREDFPWVGAVLQSYLRRTESDCRDLASTGSRVRLCKGAYKEPESVAFQRKSDVDASYVRCLEVLMQGQGYPMVATHDPAMVTAALDLVALNNRDARSYELQMLFGIRPHEQQRLAAAGHTVRVYVPYGDEWYGYLMRRLAERPANMTFFLRAMSSKN